MILWEITCSCSIWHYRSTLFHYVKIKGKIGRILWSLCRQLGRCSKIMENDSEDTYTEDGAKFLHVDPLGLHELGQHVAAPRPPRLCVFSTWTLWPSWCLHLFNHDNRVYSYILWTVTLRKELIKMCASYKFKMEMYSIYNYVILGIRIKSQLRINLKTC